MSLKLKPPSNWNVSQIGMSLKFDYPPLGMSPKLNCHSKLEIYINWNVPQNIMSI